MIDCDDVLAEVLLGQRLDEAAAGHVASCARCRAEIAGVQAVSAALGARPAPEPPPGLGERMLRVAAPALTRNARAAWSPPWRDVARALAAALLPLPVVLAADALGLRAVYDLLSRVLPSALSAYLVLSYAAVVTLLLGATYAAVPVLAAHQARLRHEERHA